LSKKDSRGLLELEILERAQNDIFDIIGYGVRIHGTPAARKYAQRISDRIKWLRSNSKLGPVNTELAGALRSFGEGKHRIYYTCDAKTLVIVRVLHQSLDETRHFN
jgi:toxin ParE1/3/4